MNSASSIGNCHVPNILELSKKIKTDYEHNK